MSKASQSGPFRAHSGCYVSWYRPALALQSHRADQDKSARGTALVESVFDCRLEKGICSCFSLQLRWWTQLMQVGRHELDPSQDWGKRGVSSKSIWDSEKQKAGQWIKQPSRRSFSLTASVRGLSKILIGPLPSCGERFNVFSRSFGCSCPAMNGTWLPCW